MGDEKRSQPTPKQGLSGGDFAGLGIQFAAAIVVFLFAGQWLDKRLGTNGLFTIRNGMGHFRWAIEGSLSSADLTLQNSPRRGALAFAARPTLVPEPVLFRLHIAADQK